MNKARIRTIIILLAAILMSAAILVFARNDAPPPNQSQESLSAIVLTAEPTGTVPPPLLTARIPTFTPGPPPPSFVPPTLPPYPHPPATVALTPGTITPPTGTPAPMPSVTAAGAKDGPDASLPNIAWGQETSDGAMTLWVGKYSDLPTPNISEARTFVSWAAGDILELEDLAFSTDGKTLAVLLLQHIEGEGFPPMWLYSVDLVTGIVRHMPDPDNPELYPRFYGQDPDRILGWLDSNRVAVQQGATPAKVVIATKDGTSYSQVPFPAAPSHVADSALSPNRLTLFSQVIGERGFWLYSTDGSNPQRLLGEEAKFGFYSKWSPNNQYISFARPGTSTQLNEFGTPYPDYNKAGVWLLNLTTTSQQLVSGEDAWNAAPAWSTNGAKLSFLRADGPIGANEAVWFNRPEGANSNIFILDVSSLTTSKLTNFTGVRNGLMQWTPGGNILLSSTAGSASGTRGVIAVSSTSDSTFTLVSSSSGQQLEHPRLFVGGLPGMPRTGESTTRP